MSPSLTYKSCWRRNLGWGSAWRCVCLADDGVEKWITASLSFKCTYSRAPAWGSDWGLQPRLTLKTVTWGHLAGFQGFGCFLLHKNIFNVYRFLNIQSRCFIFTVVNRHVKCQKLDGGYEIMSNLIYIDQIRTSPNPPYQRCHPMCSLTHRLCTWSVCRFCLKPPDWLKWCEKNVSGEKLAFSSMTANVTAAQIRLRATIWNTFCLRPKTLMSLIIHSAL